ncbi:hypothetical protein [Methylobacterium sp. WL7]|uniref:hypothetical protein n=1 Tax=Methylobacterium sp. WL7 TaxID=2603900 RepID=UPI0011CBADBD|nr:hypothetical protein [Methylobacterium sp. WL7]TXN39176.1 hypothetical protein FV233_28395 [Methylobacterium sp. WL7]
MTDYFLVVGNLLVIAVSASGLALCLLAMPVNRGSSILNPLANLSLYFIIAVAIAYNVIGAVLLTESRFLSVPFGTMFTLSSLIAVLATISAAIIQDLPLKVYSFR